MKLLRIIYNLALVLLLAAPSIAFATNGMTPISFGARAAGMGGADFAVGGTTSAMYTNPAGITSIGMRADLGVHGLMPSLTTTDSAMGGMMPLNTNHDSESAFYPMFDAGFVARVWKDLSLGLGFYVQGGMGANFKGLNTFVDADPMAPGDPMAEGAMAPATYETKSQVMLMKLAPTVAYRFNKVADIMDISLGLTGNLSIGSMAWEHGGMQFPEMDNDGMYGAHKVDFESDYAFGGGLRAGLLFEFLDGMLGLGLVYGLNMEMPFEGETTVDGMMEYDTTVEGFGWASEVGAGLAVRPVKNLLVAFDYKRLMWSSAVDVVTFKNTASGPVPQGYETLDMPFQMKWEDQNVFAVGAEYTFIDMIALRAGYNYGASAATATGINPLFPAVSESHITGGLGLIHILGGLSVDLAFEFSPENKVASNAANQMAFQPSMPGQTPVANGYQTETGMSQMTIHAGLSYDF